MILVRDVVDELMDYCFGADLKAILETEVNGHPVTVKTQFLHYYRRACYNGTVDDLKGSMIYLIELNRDLLLRIKDFYLNMEKLVDLNDYGRVKITYDETLETQGKLTNRASYDANINKSTHNSNSYDSNNYRNVSNNSTGASETNELRRVDSVIRQPLKEAQSVTIKKYTMKNNEVSSEDKVKVFDEIKVTDQGNPVYHQHFTREVTGDQSNTVNINELSNASDGLNVGNSTSATSTTKGTKRDGSAREVQYLNHDARIKAWSEEIPRLKQRFWRVFHTLFRYEHL